MSWATLQAELPGFFGGLLGIPCQWRTQPLKMQVGAHATVDLLAPTVLGVDAVRWADVGVPATAVQATVIGNRELTAQVTVWTPQQPLESSARQYLERLRTRMRLPSALETLRGLDLSHVRTEAMVDLDPVEDGRVRSQASLDVRLAYLSTEIDAEMPFIEQVRVRSEVLRDAAGLELPAGLQIDITGPPTGP